jgi:branched-chain amino acid transport system ATP-binding protein
MKTLVLNSICKNFGGLQALYNVSLEVEIGERVAIIGPNGAGKTTLFSIIAGILPSTSGTVYLFGENINHIPMHRRVDLGISQTFQLINLFKGLSVLENAVLAVQSIKPIKYSLHRPLNSYKHVIHEAEKMITEWGIWEKRDTKVSDLSYGDQRLLDIMLALAKKPRLLLLDEPTSGLAFAEIQAVISKINVLSRDITILLIEHNMDVALNLADTVIVLHMGQVLAEGTPTTVKQDSRVKQIYLGTESKKSSDTGNTRHTNLLRR